MSKFKSGDRVYCPSLFEKVYVVKQDKSKSDLNLYVEDGILPWKEWFDKNGKNSSQVAFHATPENKAALEKLYEMEFEAL